MTDTAQAVASAASSASNLSPMQTELLNRADAIFSAVAAGVQKAGAFVADQVPDIAYQYVAFGRAYNTLWLLVGIALIIFGIWAAVKFGVNNHYQLPNSSYANEPHGFRILAVAFGCFGVVFGFMMFAVNVKDALMVWFAPKVWLLLELANLIKTVKS